MMLEDGVRAGWFRHHRASPAETHSLLDRAALDLRQASKPGIAGEWRFVMAYNAALGAARAALAAHGYRASRESQHLKVIESLHITVHANSQLVRRFTHLRKKRHEVIYDSRSAISKAETRAMKALAAEVLRMVTEMLTEKPAGNIPGMPQ